jgi:sterol desaturase/sphingolipid hydroxylase (fatty acid hydroxylase superfamily)
MKLCPKCKSSPWPFAVVLFFSGIVAFLTWLMLGFAGADPMQALVGTGLAFLVVGGTLLHYVLGCMRRHCRHDVAGTAAHRAHHHHRALG